MPLFELTSNIRIGDFQFSGVHDVHVRRSMHNMIDTASIAIPSIARVWKDGVASADAVTTGRLFKDGDAVSINLGYNGDVNHEFAGFVKRRSLSMPLVVECEGYSWPMEHRVSKSGHYAKTTVKKLLALATEGTGIRVECPVDFVISGIRLVNANGVQICNYIKEASDHTLTIFFKDSKTLWCGLVYSAYANDSKANLFSLPTVNYRLGWNVVKDNGLKERMPSEPVQIKYSGKYASGVAVETESKNKAAKNKVHVLLNHVPDVAVMKSFAQEKEYQKNYTGYEGKLPGFLQPYVQPGFDAYVTDKRYPDLNGVYLVESTEVIFGLNGARRHVELGPLVGFDK